MVLRAAGNLFETFLSERQESRIVLKEAYKCAYVLLGSFLRNAR